MPSKNNQIREITDMIIGVRDVADLRRVSDEIVRLKAKDSNVNKMAELLEKFQEKINSIEQHPPANGFGVQDKAILADIKQKVQENIEHTIKERNSKRLSTRDSVFAVSLSFLFFGGLYFAFDVNSYLFPLFVESEFFRSLVLLTTDNEVYAVFVGAVFLLAMGVSNPADFHSFTANFDNTNDKKHYVLGVLSGIVVFGGLTWLAYRLRPEMLVIAMLSLVIIHYLLALLLITIIKVNVASDAVMKKEAKKDKTNDFFIDYFIAPMRFINIALCLVPILLILNISYYTDADTSRFGKVAMISQYLEKNNIDHYVNIQGIADDSIEITITNDIVEFKINSDVYISSDRLRNVEDIYELFAQVYEKKPINSHRIRSLDNQDIQLYDKQTTFSITSFYDYLDMKI